MAGITDCRISFNPGVFILQNAFANVLLEKWRKINYLQLQINTMKVGYQDRLEMAKGKGKQRELCKKSP